MYDIQNARLERVEEEIKRQSALKLEVKHNPFIGNCNNRNCSKHNEKSLKSNLRTISSLEVEKNFVDNDTAQ